MIDTSIGAVRLNMTRTEVEERYGVPSKVTVLADYFPVGTLYEGKKLTRALYSGARARCESTTSPTRSR